MSEHDEQLKKMKAEVERLQARKEAIDAKRRPTPKHEEAFCMMLYRSKSGREISIWNSRDGVTPFIVFIDDEEMQHVEWQRDKPMPDYVPKVGSWVFVDLTLQRAIEARTAYVERVWDDPEYPAKERWATKEAAVWELAHADLAQGGGGGPDLLKVTADWVSGFLAGRRNLKPFEPPKAMEPSAVPGVDA